MRRTGRNVDIVDLFSSFHPIPTRGTISDKQVIYGATTVCPGHPSRIYTRLVRVVVVDDLGASPSATPRHDGSRRWESSSSSSAMGWVEHVAGPTLVLSLLSSLATGLVLMIWLSSAAKPIVKGGDAEKNALREALVLNLMISGEWYNRLSLLRLHFGVYSMLLYAGMLTGFHRVRQFDK